MLWPDPPKGFSVDRHMQKVQGLKQLFAIYENKVMSEPVLEDMLAEIASKRGYTNPMLLRDRLPAILPPNKEVIDSRALMRLSMFLLEHHDALQQGKITLDWNGIPSIWIAGLISDVIKDPGWKPGQALRYTLKIVVLAGPPAGQVFSNSVTTRYATYLPKILGVPARTTVRVMPGEATGMYLMGKYGTTRTKPVSLLEIMATSSMKTKNKQLFRRRHPRAAV